MLLQRRRWVSSVVDGVLLTLLGLSLSAASSSNGMATQASKKALLKAVPKEEELFPHMDQALAYLQAAQRQVQQAEPWFGGHREKALPHLNAAVADVQAGIDEYMAKHPSGTRNVVNPDTIQVKMGYHFPEALRLTQQAQTELSRSGALYYGKRTAAMAEVKLAISEMNAGLAYYRAHPHKK